MAGRTLQYFMLPEECSTLLFQAAQLMGLEIWLISSGVTNTIERVTNDPRRFLCDSRPAYWISLSASRINASDCFVGTPQPAAWGWLMAEVPRFHNKALYKAQLGAKSDWFDPESRAVLENPSSISLFQKVASVFKKHLAHPAYLIDLHTGREELCKGVWYSAGAKAWLRDGGELHQEGVQFTRFTIHD